jgi:hypothetical protein
MWTSIIIIIIITITIITIETKYTYDDSLQRLKPHNLLVRIHHLDALLFISIYILV